MRVICVKVGAKYGAEWVYRLKWMVEDNLGPHEFVCMTDRPMAGIECVPAPEGLPGWWAKIGLFEPGKFPGMNLYLDLDVVITRTLEPFRRRLMEQPMMLHAIDDFSYSLRRPKQGLSPDFQRYLGGIGTINSSVMAWSGDNCREAWDKFEAPKMDEVHGDQNWLTQALWPHKIVFWPRGLVKSFKYHIMRGDDFGNVVVFHGDPKVNALPAENQLRRIWEGAVCQ